MGELTANNKELETNIAERFAELATMTRHMEQLTRQLQQKEQQLEQAKERAQKLKKTVSWKADCPRARPWLTPLKPCWDNNLGERRRAYCSLRAL